MVCETPPRGSRNLDPERKGPTVAITDINAYAHLTPVDVETLGAELDTIRRDVEKSLGERDAQYIRRAIRAQRMLEAAGRATLFASRKRSAWLLGTAMLSVPCVSG